MRAQYQKWKLDPGNRVKSFGIWVSNDALGGDPNVGVLKSLRVLVRKYDRYHPLDGLVQEFSATEGNQLSISLDSITESSSSSAASDRANQFYGEFGGGDIIYEVLWAT